MTQRQCRAACDLRRRSHGATRADAGRGECPEIIWATWRWSAIRFRFGTRTVKRKAIEPRAREDGPGMMAERNGDLLLRELFGGRSGQHARATPFPHSPSIRLPPAPERAQCVRGRKGTPVEATRRSAAAAKFSRKFASSPHSRNRAQADIRVFPVGRTNANRALRWHHTGTFLVPL